MKLVALFVLLVCDKSAPLNIDVGSAVYYSPDPTVSKLNTELAYFGYSLASFRAKDSSWLLVGAPKSNSSKEFPLRGVVHVCEVSTDNKSCQMFSRNVKSAESLENDQMYGVTLAAYDSRESTEVAVCDSKYSTLIKEKPSSVGSCFVYKNGDMIDSLNAPVGHTPQGTKWHVTTFAQFGFSLHKSQDGRLFIGAPGINHWRGGAEVLFGKSNCSYKDISEEEGALSGYSIYSVKNAGERSLLLLGAPRYGGRGKVLMLDVDDECQSDLIQHFEGTQIGSMFGSSLLAVDVDDDGTDEILVAAPFFNLSRGDEGAVFVYKHISGLYSKVATLIGGAKNGSRFGTSLHSLDDVNLDGYRDVIIGSPYEDRGAAYVYFGGSNTFENDYSQRIDASELNEDLQRFGFSFQTVPLNGAYGALAVGSYLSDLVTVMRIRPFHRISAKIKFHSKMIEWQSVKCSEFKSETINLQFNLEFTYILPEKELEKFGKSFFKGAEINYTLSVDTQHQRGFLVTDSTEKKSQTVGGAIKLDALTPSIHAHEFTFNTKKISKFLKLPVEFHLNYSVTKYDKEINPVIDIMSPTTAQILFAPIRTSDECKPNIFYEATPQGSAVVGTLSPVAIEVFVANSGDPAHNTGLEVSHSSWLRFLKTSKDFVNCEAHDEEHRVSCEIDRVILAGSPLYFKLNFETRDTWKREPIEVRIKLPEIDGAEKRVDIPVSYLSELLVIKSAKESSHEDSYEILHFFDIRNKGPGLHPNLCLSALVPSSLISSSSTPCCSESFVKIDLKSKPRDGNSIDLIETHGPKKNTSWRKYLDSLQDSSTNVSLDCKHVECDWHSVEVKDLRPGDSIDVTVRTTINGSLLSFFKKFSKLSFKSRLEIRPSSFNGSNVDSNCTGPSIEVELISTSASPPGYRQIPLWLIGLCVFLGILHLVVAVAILKKCGFFRRERREKLMKEKLLVEDNGTNFQGDDKEDQTTVAGAGGELNL